MKAPAGLALAIVLIAGCKSNKITGTNQNSDTTQNNADNAAQVNQYLDSLPTWAQFSPLLAEDSSTTGDPTMSYDTVASVTSIDSTGNTSTSTNVPYVCSTTPYSLQKTPQQIVMYSPNASILYPGAFIQGKSYKSGIGSLLSLDIAKRAPIQVSIPDFSFTDNYRTVDTVDEAHVASAVGSLVGEATTSGVQAPSSVDFHMDKYYSQSQAALSMNASGHYLGFSASASGSISTSASEHTVVAQFYEKMFTVVVSRPTTTTTGPAAWFRSDFTRADLQQQVAAGNIGPGNLPVYIGEIAYGRMMMFSLTSTASAKDIKAALTASYNGLVGGGSVSMSAEDSTILQTATITVATMGGSDKNALAAIRSGNFNDYFTSSPPLSTAQPLSYDFYNLVDNTLAQVTEATNYNVTTCEQVQPGQFDFLPTPESFAAPVPVPFDTRLVDVNGDGMADLVFNHRDAGGNQVAVALGQANGTFAAPSAAVSNPATPSGGWANDMFETGDFNGDGQTDLVWNKTDSLNDSYVALADGSGGWTFEPLQEATLRGWTDYKLYVGDVNGDGCDDLIWNNQTTGGSNHVAVALSKCDGTFALPNTQQQLGSGGWGQFGTWVADYNKDGRADLVFNESINGAATWTEVATSNGDGTFNYVGTTNQTYGNEWGGYHRLVADFTGDQVPDLLLYRDPETTPSPSQAYVLSGMQNMVGPINLDSLFSTSGTVTPVAGDLNGDGIADLVIDNVSNTTNTIGVVMATGNPGTPLSVPANPTQQYPSSTNWTTALPAMVGDVNGDHNADVVWVISGSTTQVFVALSKGNAPGL